MRWSTPASVLALVATLLASPGLAAPPVERGYWLGVELAGPAPAIERALETLRHDPELPAAPAGVPAHVVGRVATVQDALRFVGAEVFDGPPVGDGEDATLLREPAAPVPGGRLRREHGVFLLRMTLTGSGPDGAPRPIVWPRDAAAVLPAELPWTAVELAPARAPLFAAPAPGTPPMRERHAIASRDGALYRLGTLDRCTGEGARMACLRWAQVVARDGDRFVGGYLPAHQVVDPRGWVRGRTRWPAVQAVHSGVRDGQAQILVRGHAPDGVPHQITLSAALVDGRLPRVELGLAGVDVRIDIEGQPSRRIVLDEALDRFPRE